MKITFLIRRLDYGGAERQLIGLAKGLGREGHCISIVTFYGGGALANELLEASVQVISLAKKSRWDVLGFTWRLINVVRAERPDVLHGYLGISNILTVVLRAFLPGLRIAWGVRASNMQLSHYDWTTRFAYRIERSLSRLADLIIVNSRAGYNYASAQGFPRDRMVIIPNGIDTERFRPDRAAAKRVRAEWDVHESDLLVGSVGRLDPMKDHSTFLRAAAQLAKERHDLRFVCVGDGPDRYRQELQMLGEQLGLAERLVWSCGRDDMPAVYNALDILVSSSSFGEGFSNVVGEAMACCVPCVVTDVGDSALIVGDNGEVVPPADDQAMRDAISRVADRVRAADYRPECNRERIVDRFSVDQLQAKTASALAKLSPYSSVA
jgi:glycosyltransferase involved in cell wall biosynthesis